MSKGLDSLIEATTRGLREENDFSHRWCKFFTEECIEQLSEYAKNRAECGHDCEYCKKYKWTIDRAKHYAEKLDLGWEDVLTSWEVDRGYWYLNYYQDCKQPEINSGKVRVFGTADEFRQSVGKDGFRCPSCGGISTNPYECNSGIKPGNGKSECDWKVYGLFRDMGKGAFIYCKDKLKGETIFMPVAWESEAKI